MAGGHTGFFPQEAKTKYFRGCVSGSHFTNVLLRYGLKPCVNSWVYHKKSEALAKNMQTAMGYFKASFFFKFKDMQIL